MAPRVLCLVGVLAASIEAMRLKKRKNDVDESQSYEHFGAVEPLLDHTEDDMIDSLPAKSTPTITLVQSGPGWQRTSFESKDPPSDAKKFNSEQDGEWLVCGIFLTWYERGYFITGFLPELQAAGKDGWKNRGSVAKGECVHKTMARLQVGMKLTGVGKLGLDDEKPQQLRFTYVFPIVHTDMRLDQPTAAVGELPPDEGDGRCCVASRVTHRCLYMSKIIEYHCSVAVYWQARSDDCQCGLLGTKTVVDTCAFHVTFGHFDDAQSTEADKELALDARMELALFPKNRIGRMGSFRLKHFPVDKVEKGFIATIRGVYQDQLPVAPGFSFNGIRSLVYKYADAYSRAHMFKYNCQQFSAWLMGVLTGDPNMNKPYGMLFSPVTDVDTNIGDETFDPVAASRSFSRQIQAPATYDPTGEVLDWTWGADAVDYAQFNDHEWEGD